MNQHINFAVAATRNQNSRNLGLAGAMSVSIGSLLGGCQAPQQIPADYGPPPQESLTQVAPGVSRCQMGLSRIIDSGDKISTTDGISYDEAWRLMACYLLRRSELSAISLNDGLANNAADYTTIRDAQLINQLGLMLESDASCLGTKSISRTNVGALGMLKLDDVTLMNRATEGEVLARNFSTFLAQVDGERAGKDARFVQKLAGIVAADIALAVKPGSLRAQAVKARLQEDVMALEWLRVCAAVKFTEVHPTAKALISNYSSQAAAAIQSDFGVFDSVWGTLLNKDAQTVWNNSPSGEKIGIWVFVRAIEPKAWNGSSMAPAVQASSETLSINKMFGMTR